MLLEGNLLGRDLTAFGFTCAQPEDSEDDIPLAKRKKPSTAKKVCSRWLLEREQHAPGLGNWGGRAGQAVHKDPWVPSTDHRRPLRRRRRGETRATTRATTATTAMTRTTAGTDGLAGPAVGARPHGRSGRQVGRPRIQPEDSSAAALHREEERRACLPLGYPSGCPRRQWRDQVGLP